MASLEDKILGEKSQYYCSSSSDSECEANDNDEGACCSNTETSSANQGNDKNWNGVSSNTGPKGVIKDWEDFKKLEHQKKLEKEQQKIMLIKKFALTCRTAAEEERDEMDELDKELNELFEDEFVKEYRQKRMNEMLSNNSKLPTFGKLIHLKNGDEFLNALDNENKAVTVIVHIFADTNSGCKVMNGCLGDLSRLYPQVKFCKLNSGSAGMSSNFKSEGVPALLVYKAGQMVGNFIRVTDELGDEFYTDDVESYLIEHGMLNDRSCVPSIVCGVNDDSDVSLD